MDEIPLIEKFHEVIEHDCIEIYLPKSLKYLSELYDFLRMTLSNPASGIILKGFSIYEVDGAFQGDETYEERTLVIRLFLPRAGNEEPTIAGKVKELGSQIISIASQEEQIWICHYPQTVTIFRPTPG
jgi:hypothetical protein